LAFVFFAFFRGREWPKKTKRDHGHLNPPARFFRLVLFSIGFPPPAARWTSSVTNLASEQKETKATKQGRSRAALDTGTRLPAERRTFTVVAAQA
jgi:hypothetical protein